MVILESCNDEEVISFPYEKDLLKNTLRDKHSLDGMSDRSYGRKLYPEVYNAGFSEINVKSYYITTAGMDIDE